MNYIKSFIKKYLENRTINTAKKNFRDMLMIENIMYGARWGGYSIELQAKLLQERTLSEWIDDALEFGKFENRYTNEYYHDFKLKYERLHLEILKTDNKFLARSEASILLGKCGTYLHEGLLHSAPLFQHSLHMGIIEQHLNPNIICEIGGGYGGPCYSWFKNSQKAPDIYIDIDIPSSLFYAEIFIRSTLPSVKVMHLGRCSAIPKLKPNTVILCPPDKIDLLKDLSLDVVINTGSFAEMSAEYVSKYLSFINHSNVHFYLTHNRFAENFLVEGNESMNYETFFPSSSFEPILAKAIEGDEGQRHSSIVLFKKSNLINTDIKYFKKLSSKINNYDDFLSIILLLRDPTKFEQLVHFINSVENSEFLLKSETLFLYRTLKENKPDFENKKLDEIIVKIEKNILINNCRLMHKVYYQGDISSYYEFYASSINKHGEKLLNNLGFLLGYILIHGETRELTQLKLSLKYLKKHKIVRKNLSILDTAQSLISTISVPSEIDDPNKIFSIFRSQLNHSYLYDCELADDLES